MSDNITAIVSVSPLTPAGFNRLCLDEGERYFIYDDKTGLPVHRLPSGGWPTIGIGRNLSARGITEAEAQFMLANDIASMWAAITRGDNAWIAELPPVWRDVVLMVEFNVGDVFTFPKMLAAMKANDAATASAELLDSKAAKEGIARYQRMAAAITVNSW